VDRLLVATQGGGIVISEDGCMSWSASNDGLATLFVNTLAVDPSRPNTFYAATDAGAYVSEDDGASWALISGWLPEDSLVYSLVVDPRFPGVLYAATPEGVFRWELAPTPVPALPSWESDLRAFADPILESVTSRTPVFEYDFSSVSPASTSFLGAPTIAGGVFQCQVQGDEACGFSWEGGTSDFVAEYEFTYMTPSSPALVSLKFRASEDQSLQFWMSLLPSPTTGAWWILREDYEAGNIGPNVGEGTSEAVALGPQTRVTVIALGSQVAVLLNGEPLAFYAGSSVRGQSYELRLEAAQQNAEVHFDNVRFWDIRDYTAPPPTATAATPPPTVTAAESWVTDFAEPILQAIEGRTPVFEDDFSTFDEDWVPWPQEGADCIDGAMRFTVTSGNLSLGRPREIAHFVFQFDIIPRRLNVSDEVGSIFRHGGTEDSESWEAFMISPGGGTSGGDRWSWIRDPGASGEPIVLESGELPILHFSEPTRVTVIASRDEAAVYLNGQPVAYRDDSTMRGEWHTLFLSSVSGVSEVEFDNVRFWDITDLTIP
jgi:hypothetical protein